MHRDARAGTRVVPAKEAKAEEQRWGRAQMVQVQVQVVAAAEEEVAVEAEVGRGGGKGVQAYSW